ncbi:ATP-binding cassette domain-containing protein [Treponema phagedenis]|uniref:ATP-binding cassette domain-containing protein n=1 Tax=Treponema phagedenis TaxID=162 RepID=UPI0001F6416B|nr:ATP-binding cassette domain-containing protein [Treponema phagedenis]EFW38359.1 ABC transporter, ATP-binding protein [Treponema phagedenis F0421]TYT78537.1 ATP-binding cassette domain-containing protein [Treponema phagedenis]
MSPRSLSVKNIYKIYENAQDGALSTAKTALNGANVSFFIGELHALLGENGAGKSTLVHILSGLCEPTEGDIFLGEKAVSFTSSAEALDSGIGIVHQHPLLIEDATVFENIIIGNAVKTRFGFIHRKEIKARAESLIAEWNMGLSLSSKIRHLSSDKKFYAALLATLYRNPSFLILDEPGSAFTNEERDSFFVKLKKILRERKDSFGVILITHKLEEALDRADRISVLHKGTLCYSVQRSELPHSESEARSIIERKMFQDMDMLTVCEPAPVSEKNEAAAVFSVEKLSASFEFGEALQNISFSAKQKSITGIIGMPNSGLNHLEDILSGMVSAQNRNNISGALTINTNGTKILLPAASLTPALLHAHNIGFVPSDRNMRGSNPLISIFDLLIPYRAKGFFLQKKELLSFVKSILAAEHIDASPSRPASTLSGGQLQRLILARELATNPSVLILAEPAWGLDRLGTRILTERLQRAAALGTAIIMLTKEFDNEFFAHLFSEVFFLKSGMLKAQIIGEVLE